MTKLISNQITIILVVLLILLGFSIRMLQLDKIPYGALVDEANFGYIAYSLLKTGKDEHGQSMPIIFQAFGDQKLPVYAYLLTPFVSALDLSNVTIRLPSALAGTFLIPLLFILTIIIGLPKEWALVASAVTAFSPWTFILSRFGYESNVALFIFVAGLCLLFSLHNKAKLWQFGLTGLVWALTWYSYIAYRPVTFVLLGLVTGLWVWQKKFSSQQLCILWLVFAITVLPLFSPAAVQSNTTRFNQIGIASDKGMELSINENRTFCAESLPRILCDTFWNKASVGIHSIVSRYLAVYSPNYLATHGDSGDFLNVENHGQFAAVLYPFLLIGIASLLFTGKSKDYLLLAADKRMVLLAGLVLGPIPAILAGEPQKVRLSVLLPFLIICIVLGLYHFWYWLKELSIKKTKFPQLLLPYLFFSLITALFVFSTLQFLAAFYFIQTQKYDFSYSSYVRDISSYIAMNIDDHQIIIHPFYSEPIMMYAFYNKIDPHFYHQTVVLDKPLANGFQHAVQLGNLHVLSDSFTNIACRAVLTGEPTIYITSPVENQGVVVPKEALLTTFKSQNGVMSYALAFDMLAIGKENQQMCANIQANNSN